MNQLQEGAATYCETKDHNLQRILLVTYLTIAAIYLLSVMFAYLQVLPALLFLSLFWYAVVWAHFMLKDGAQSIQVRPDKRTLHYELIRGKSGEISFSDISTIKVGLARAYVWVIPTGEYPKLLLNRTYTNFSAMFKELQRLAQLEGWQVKRSFW